MSGSYSLAGCYPTLLSTHYIYPPLRSGSFSLCDVSICVVRLEGSVPTTNGMPARLLPACQVGSVYLPGVLCLPARCVLLMPV